MDALERLNELLLAWQERWAEGRDVPAAELCPDDPGLATELQRRIEVLRHVERMVRGAAASAPTTRLPDSTSSPVEPPQDSGPGIALSPPQGPGELGRLGGFRVLRRLGAGGMGLVFEAQDPVLGRPVALKVMKPELAAQPTARRRFLREARAAGALHHDHIVPIWQVGEDRATPFLAMPLLAGESLEARLQRQPLTLAEAVRVGRQTAEALAAAHAAGLVHRDIKPANLWLETLSADGQGPAWRVKVLDFGLARPLATTDELTPTEALLGTPGYLAPEQMEGGRADARSDLFGLGCVLYRLLTGRAPFHGPTLLATLQATAAEEPPPPRAHNPQVPATLSDLVLRLLAKDPARRPASARALADALQAVEAGQDAPLPAVRRRWRRLGGVAGLAALALAAVLLWPWRQPPAPTHPVPPVGGSPAAGGQGRGPAGLTEEPAPLKGSIDVRVWEKGNPRRQGLRLHQTGSLPLHENDLLRIEVELNRPAYLYVVWLEASGDVRPLYPWRSPDPRREADWKDRPAGEKKRDRLTLPEEKDGAPLGGGPSGIESLLLLVREEPLPVDVNLSALFQGLPKQKAPDLRAAAWFENGQLVKDEPDRGAIQIGQAQGINDPVLRTQALLRGRLRELFPYTRAVCFSFTGNEQGPGARDGALEPKAGGRE
jgi:hypothetical protein